MKKPKRREAVYTWKQLERAWTSIYPDTLSDASVLAWFVFTENLRRIAARKRKK